MRIAVSLSIAAVAASAVSVSAGDNQQHRQLSKSSKSGTSMEEGWYSGSGSNSGPWNGGYHHPSKPWGGWHYVAEDSSSSSSGSSSKSGKGSKSSGKSSKSSGKSSKSSGKSSKSSGKSGKSESDDKHNSWHGSHHHSHASDPWGGGGGWYGGDSSSSGKSGKSSGKSAKSGTSSGSSSGDGDYWLGGGGGGWSGHNHPHEHDGTWHSHPHSHDDDDDDDDDQYVPDPLEPEKPDSSSPGVCAPTFSNGGLNCAHDLYINFCTKIGSKSECDSGEMCYDKALCPNFNDDDHSVIGVCSSGTTGLECSKVATYCTEPGGHGECGESRDCYDAGLCGLGSGSNHDYDGICGFSSHHGGGLECSAVTTQCTKSGDHAECADGAFCFSKDVCDGENHHAGFCASEDGFSCDDDIETFCSEPGKDGQCGYGKKCYAAGLCDVKGDFPGVCAPSDGLSCVDVEMYCTEPGSQAECGHGNSCYDVNLCTGDGAEGVCASKEEGLMCEEVTTFCSAPGSSAECGSGYHCLDADLCGGDAPAGVCASVEHGLECSIVTTFCSEPGEQSECGSGFTCMDSALCAFGDEIPEGVCAPKNGDLKCGKVTTFCTEPYEQAECANGNTCVSSEKCGYDHGGSHGEDVCFVKGVLTECTHEENGGAVYVPFTYNVETSYASAEEVIEPVEYEILAAVSDFVAGSGEYESITRISAAPSDMIDGDVICDSENSSNSCTVVKGEMTFYQSSDDMDPCKYNDIVKSSIEESDFSNVDGVESVRYTGADGACDFDQIISNPVDAQEDDGLGAGAMFGIAAAAAALAALALLAAKRRSRQKPVLTDEQPKDDFSLISNDDSIEGRFLGAVGNDPFASTVDVHKCTSMYCNCNKGMSDTTFIPVPQDNIGKKQLQALASPQGVDEAQEFFPDEPEEDVIDESPRDTIMRIPPSLQNPTAPHRSLTPVNEVPHDSEIDTEFESEGEDDSMPPPPPPPLPSNYGGRNSALDSDEMSI